jgi:hypothetical protein
MSRWPVGCIRPGQLEVVSIAGSPTRSLYVLRRHLLPENARTYPALPLQIQRLPGHSESNRVYFEGVT